MAQTLLYFRPQWSKSIPYFRLKRLENHTLWRRTYLSAHIRKYTPSEKNSVDNAIRVPSVVWILFETIQQTYFCPVNVYVQLFQKLFWQGEKMGYLLGYPMGYGYVRNRGKEPGNATPKGTGISFFRRGLMIGTNCDPSHIFAASSLKDVRAHCLCASLLRRNSQRARWVRNIDKYSGCGYFHFYKRLYTLKCTVTPFVFPINHFLHWFSAFCPEATKFWTWEV